jgi:hypothetical protein
MINISNILKYQFHYYFLVTERYLVGLVAIYSTKSICYSQSKSRGLILTGFGKLKRVG